MKISKYLIILLSFYLIGCQISEDGNKEINHSIVYNLIEPGNGIYKVTVKNVSMEKIKNEMYEAVHYKDKNIVKIERHDKNGKLTDDLSVAAVTYLEYNSNNNLKYLKYFDKLGSKWEDDIFGYWSIEYIYDDQNRIVMEIYRDLNSKFLEVPVDKNGEISKSNFIPPILTYEYLGDNYKIKAFDKHFNLLKEVVGEKPCVPFIDCGDSDF